MRPTPIRRHAYTPIRLFRWIALALWLCLISCASRSGSERRDAAADPDEQFWRTIEKGDVIYVGETHDDPAHHRYELELIRGLLKRKMKFAIGWEMFDETQQIAIDAWASRAISLKVLLARTDFQKHWGIYSPVYEQILQIARNADVPNLALNAPQELTRKIARGEPLTAEETALMPTGFVATEEGFRNFVSMMGEHPGMDQTEQRRFFDAQNLWDQTMASRILNFEDRNPKVKLVVLTGRGHVSGGYGIPFYVKQKSDLRQVVLFPKPALIAKAGASPAFVINARCGDHICGPRVPGQPWGIFVPSFFRNPDNLFLQEDPRTGNRRRALLLFAPNRPLSSSAPRA